MAYGDLHIHTNVSDGVYSPEEVAQKIVESELGFFSIADHNSVVGLRRVDRVLPAHGPRFIYGVELSAQPAEGDEMHLLGYGFDPGSVVLRAICKDINQRKEEQLREMAHRLRKQGRTWAAPCWPKCWSDAVSSPRWARRSRGIWAEREPLLCP